MSANQKTTLVLKIGGNQVEDEAFLAGFVAAVAGLRTEHSVIIVHGGGKEITDLHTRSGVATETVEGLRADERGKPAAGRDGAERHGQHAAGALVGGRRGGCVGAERGRHGPGARVSLAINGRSLGRVGKVGAVNGEALLQLLDLELTPVISPVSLGEDGLTYNVNADHVAAGVAVAVEASKLIFVSNVPGVQVTGRTMRALTVSQIEGLIADGHITGGMIPKVRSATEAVASGVYQAVITDLDGLARGEGTAVIRDA